MGIYRADIQTEESPGTDSVSVLIVEPHPLMRDAIVRTCRGDPRIGSVWDAPGGRSALTLAREHQPTVAVLALQLRDSGGLHVLEQLVELPSTRVLVFTSCEKSDVLFEAIRRGAGGYLTKHASADSLLEALHMVAHGVSTIDPLFSGSLAQLAFPGEYLYGHLTLARREQQVLRLIADGMTDKEIGLELFISPRTVQNHLKSIRTKTGAHRRSEIARWAVEHALV